MTLLWLSKCLLNRECSTCIIIWSASGATADLENKAYFFHMQQLMQESSWLKSPKYIVWWFYTFLRFCLESCRHPLLGSQGLICSSRPNRVGILASFGLREPSPPALQSIRLNLGSREGTGKMEQNIDLEIQISGVDITELIGISWNICEKPCYSESHDVKIYQPEHSEWPFDKLASQLGHLDMFLTKGHLGISW